MFLLGLAIVHNNDKWTEGTKKTPFSGGSEWVGFSSSAASFGPPEYFSCAWEKPFCLPVFCFLWVRSQPGEVPGPLGPFSSWPVGLVRDGGQLAPFSLEGKSKAVWGTSPLLFCPPNSLFFVKPSFKLGCTTSRGGHIQTHTQRLGKVHKGSATLYRFKEPPRL